MHHNLFLIYGNSNQVLDSIRSVEVIEFSIKNKHTKRILDNLNKFMLENKCNFDNNTDNIEVLVFNYWYHIITIYKHIKSNTGWKDSRFNSFVISSIRLLEFVTYLLHIQDHELNEVYFKNYSSNDNFYFHLAELDSKIKIAYCSLFQRKKKNYLTFEALPESAKIDKNFQPQYLFTSTIKMQPSKHDYSVYMDYYLKLQDKYIAEFHQIAFSNNEIDGRNSIGQKGDRVAFEVYDTVNLTHIVYGTKEKVGEETKKEYKLKNKILQSPLVDERVGNLVNDDFNNLVTTNSIESKFKRFQISRAISASITKRNLHLASDYMKPEIELLREFFKFIFHEESLVNNIISLSVLFGIKVQKLIAIILQIDSQVEYRTKDGKLHIRVNKKIFAQITTNEDLSENVKSNICDIYLNDSMQYLWVATTEMLNMYISNTINQSIIVDNNIDFDEEVVDRLVYYIKDNKDRKNFQNLIDEKFDTDTKNKISKLTFIEPITQMLVDDTKKHLTYQSKLFPKKINLNLNTLSQLSHHYYKLVKNKSDISLLYSQNISTNDEARLCYCATKERLYSVEMWLEELSIITGIKETLLKNYPYSSSNTIYKTSKWVGSNYFIKPGAFKTFLLNLQRLEIKNELDKANILMIFIRYSFSILLATRDFNNSCNLSNYSKKLKILTLQEKGKNIYAGKRVIPLSDRGLKYIDMFEELKDIYKIASSSPVILSYNDNDLVEEHITKKSTTKFLETINTPENQSIVDDLIKFINFVKLNFGRHIVTSYLVTSDLESNYLDAYLNHYKMGSEDQGIYSYFSNKEYIYKILEQIKEIENIYFPINMEIENYA